MSLRDRWSLTEVAFEQLLGRLDPDRERAGEKYQLLRTKLVKFFEWRGSSFPEEQADTALDRVVQRLGRGEPIDNVEAFVCGVARMVLLEGRREQQGERRRLAALVPAPADAEPGPDRCLETCLGQLAPAERELIIAYYRDEGSGRIAERKALAARLQIPIEVLRLRAHRIRVRIEGCLRRCLGFAPGGR
jgi:DNA-directed RNA polymerase specialized sigma24 family protein